MSWMMAAEGYYNDGYTLYASSPDLQPLKDMCRQVNGDNGPHPVPTR
jgi:hypothetical protein